MNSTDENGRKDDRIKKNYVMLSQRGISDTNTQINMFSFAQTKDNNPQSRDDVSKAPIKNRVDSFKTENIQTHRRSCSDGLNTALFVRRLTELNLSGDYNDPSELNKDYAMWTFVPPINTGESKNTCRSTPCDQAAMKTFTHNSEGYCDEKKGSEEDIGTLPDSPCRCDGPDLSLLRQNSVQKRALQICRERRRKIRRRYNSDANLHMDHAEYTKQQVIQTGVDNTTSSPQISPDYRETRRPDIIAYLTEETRSGEKIVFPCRQNSIQKQAWLRTQKHRQRRRMMRSQTS